MAKLRRQPFDDFDADVYLAKYQDLALHGLGRERAREHFEVVGHRARSCDPGPVVFFDSRLYRERYADLRHLSDKGAVQHWRDHGLWEGRLGGP